jgi:hypothetical protein
MAKKHKVTERRRPEEMQGTTRNKRRQKNKNTKQY